MNNVGKYIYSNNLNVGHPCKLVFCGFFWRNLTPQLCKQRGEKTIYQSSCCSLSLCILVQKFPDIRVTLGRGNIYIYMASHSQWLLTMNIFYLVAHSSKRKLKWGTCGVPENHTTPTEVDKDNVSMSLRNEIFLNFKASGEIFVPTKEREREDRKGIGREILTIILKGALISNLWKVLMIFANNWYSINKLYWNKQVWDRSCDQWVIKAKTISPVVGNGNFAELFPTMGSIYVREANGVADMLAKLALLCRRWSDSYRRSPSQCVTDIVMAERC